MTSHLLAFVCGMLLSTLGWFLFIVFRESKLEQSIQDGLHAARAEGQRIEYANGYQDRALKA